MNVWQTGETLRQAKGYTSPLLFRELEGFFKDGVRGTHNANHTPGSLTVADRNLAVTGGYTYIRS